MTAGLKTSAATNEDDALTHLQDALRKLDSAAFTSLHVLDRLPHAFSTREQYAAWRSVLARGLDVDPLCVVVVGSGAVGYSLSPWEEKRFRAFHAESDIDVAVVSSTHFEEAWRNIRNMRDEPARKIQDLWKRHRRSLVFDGTIATDKVLPHLTFGAKWTSALGRAALLDPTRDRDVKARIYRDFESLRDYQRRNIERLRSELLDDKSSELSQIEKAAEDEHS